MSDSMVVALSDLKPDPENRRKHNDRNLSMIASALQDVGTGRSVVVDEDLMLLAGNGVREAAARAGVTRVRVIDTDGDELIAVRRTGLTADQKRALALYDNRTAELAGWDFEQLAADKAAGLTFQPFWTEDEESALLASVSHRAMKDPDRIPQDRETDIQPGDLFTLGRHRLICGDSTDPEVLTALMTDRAALVFTSPPYAEQRKEQYGGVPADDYQRWFGTVQGAFRPQVATTGHFVLNIKPHAKDLQRSLYVFDLVSWLVRSAGWLFVDEFCWLRHPLPQQVSHRFKNSFEPVYWFANGPDYRWFPEAVMHQSEGIPLPQGPGAGDTNAANRQGKGSAVQGNTVVPGLAYPSNVLDLKHNPECPGHPAAFTVRLPKFFIECMTARDDVVLDPFTGSGTTIMAAEVTGRRGCGVELLPKYCQLAIDRWEAFTGLTAERVSRAGS